MSLNSSSSVPSLITLESLPPASASASFSSSQPPSSFPPSARYLSSLSHAASTTALESLPAAIASSTSAAAASGSCSASLGRPSLACCYISVGHHWSTGVLCCHLGVYFVLTNHRILASPSAAAAAHATFNYQTSAAVRVTLDPSVLFLTSPCDSLDFTLVSLSRESFARLEELDTLQAAYALDEHIDKKALERHTALDIYQHHPHAPLECAPGYLHCQYPTWIAYAAACHPKSCGGLIVHGSELVGLHRCRNDSRRWNEGTLAADIVPLVTPYLQAVKQRAANQSWLAHIFKPMALPQSPRRQQQPQQLQPQQLKSLSPPGSPRVLLVVREKGRVDVLAALLLAAVVIGWLLHMSSKQHLSGGVSGLLDSKWALNAVAVALVLAFHTALYFAYKRWRQQPPSLAV